MQRIDTAPLGNRKIIALFSFMADILEDIEVDFLLAAAEITDAQAEGVPIDMRLDHPFLPHPRVIRLRVAV